MLFELTYLNEEASSVLQKYDIRKNEVTETTITSHPTWYAENLYSLNYIRGEDDRFETSVYRMDVDGTNREDVIESVPNGSLLMSDGKYLYRNNAWEHYSFPEEEFRYWVYDQDMNLIDEFVSPETGGSLLGSPIGGSGYQYLLFDDENGQWGLYVWDKSSIGSLHGAPYTQEKIIYGVNK